MITNLFCPQVASKMGFGDARKTFEKVRIQSPLQALRQTAGFPRTFSTHIKLCRAGQALQSAPPPSRVPPTGAPGSRRRAAGRATGRVGISSGSEGTELSRTNSRRTCPERLSRSVAVLAALLIHGLLGWCGCSGACSRSTWNAQTSRGVKLGCRRRHVVVAMSLSPCRCRHVVVAMSCGRRRHAPLPLQGVGKFRRTFPSHISVAHFRRTFP